MLPTADLTQNTQRYCKTYCMPLRVPNAAMIKRSCKYCCGVYECISNIHSPCFFNCMSKVWFEHQQFPARETVYSGSYVSAFVTSCHTTLCHSPGYNSSHSHNRQNFKFLICRFFCKIFAAINFSTDNHIVGQWWANYGPRARCGPLRGSIRPAADFKIIV